MEARAKELIEMIASPQLLSLAVKYASKLGRIHLVDKLSELLPHIEEQVSDPFFSKIFIGSILVLVINLYIFCTGKDTREGNARE